MNIHIELSETDLKTLVYNEIQRLNPGFEFEPNKVKIQVKSKQNYRSEWEEASFRAVLDLR